MAGNLAKVVKKIDEFVLSYQELEPFARKIRELAEDFDEEPICDLIEQYI